MGVDKLSVEPTHMDSFSQVYQREGGEQVTAQNMTTMLKWEEKYYKKYDQMMFMDAESKKEVEKMKKIFLEDLSYVSLALIQKTSFESV